MFPLSQNYPSSSHGGHQQSSGGGNHHHHFQTSHNRNYGAAFFQMMTIALLCTSLAQPSWLTLVTRTMPNAPRPAETCPRHLTLYQFFDYGYFETSDSGRNTTSGAASIIRLYYHSATGTLACLTPTIVNLFKIILMLVIIGIILSFIGFLLDILGTKSRLSLAVRANGLLTIPIVLICAGVVSLCYYITVLLEKDNRHSRFVEVSFDYGFFTLSAAGATSLLATASALFKRMDGLGSATLSSGSERRRSRSRHRRSRSSRHRDSRLVLVDSIESPPLILTGDSGGSGSPGLVCDPPPPYSL